MECQAYQHVLALYIYIYIYIYNMPVFLMYFLVMGLTFFLKKFCNIDIYSFSQFDFRKGLHVLEQEKSFEMCICSF